MEKLYNRGYLSYPRTETTCFAKSINLKNFVNNLTGSDEDFGAFAQRVYSGELYGGPRNGKKDDKAHPPIHPVKLARRHELSPEEWRIYELVARHFLATLSKDAVE